MSLLDSGSCVVTRWHRRLQSRTMRYSHFRASSRASPNRSSALSNVLFSDGAAFSLSFSFLGKLCPRKIQPSHPPLFFSYKSRRSSQDDSSIGSRNFVKILSLTLMKVFLILPNTPNFAGDLYSLVPVAIRLSLLPGRRISNLKD